MKVAVFGDPRLGGVQLRGVQLASQLGVPFIPLPLTEPAPQLDVGVMVKYGRGYEVRIREACRFVIYDPLDDWGQQDVNPYEHWRRIACILRPTVMIATSPACVAVMKLGRRYVDLPPRLHLIPHAPDTRLNWHRDKDAPVAYVGDTRYLDGHSLYIINACKKSGRQVRFIEEPPVELSACLLLHPRLGRSATAINRLCKPQIKLANAARAGIPVLATDDPAVMTLAENVTTLPVGEWSDVDALASAIDQAVSAEAVDVELSQDNYAEALIDLLETL